MVRNVLLVDDDRVLQRVVEKKLSGYAKAFRVLISSDGLEAVEKLKERSISLVITDLNMPNMDGLALMAHMTVYYPDIPVIVLTGDKTPTRQDAALQSGAVWLFEKPVDAEQLGKKIIETLKKESEGGVLQAVSLQMFTQLVNMEARTCTIRVINKQNGRKGVLFFKQGELMDARLASVYGTDAAYRIFAWDETILFIQNDCPLEKKRIEEGIQAVVMEALRRKDEAAQASATEQEAPQRHLTEQLPMDTNGIHPDYYSEARTLCEEMLSAYPLLTEQELDQVRDQIRASRKMILELKRKHLR